MGIVLTSDSNNLFVVSGSTLENIAELEKLVRDAFPDLEINEATSRYIQEKIAKEMGLNPKTSPESK